MGHKTLKIIRNTTKNKKKKPQETPDLVTFTEEILNGKLQFFCSVSIHRLVRFCYMGDTISNYTAPRFFSCVVS